MNIIRVSVFLMSLLSCGLLVDVKAQAQPRDLERVCELADKGKLEGIISFRVTRFLSSKTSTRLFLAAWFVTNNQSTQPDPRRELVIFEKDEAGYREVFNLDEKDALVFHGFAPLNSLAVPGIVVNFSDDLDGTGHVLVVALIRDRFQIVYRGESSEIVDLDGNGIPEIFESVWPDGDGYPKSTTIHVWDGTRYQKLVSSKWGSRFSQPVLNRIKKYEKTRLGTHPAKSATAVHPQGTGY